MNELESSAPYRAVVATDFSQSSELAITAALESALQRPSAELHVIHVIDDLVGAWPGLSDEERRHEAAAARETLRRRTIERLVEAGPTPLDQGRVTIHVRVGEPAEQIVRLAAEIVADLVIVGTHGRRGLRRAIVGSIAEKVCRLAPCPVLVARARRAHAAEAVPEPTCPECAVVQADSSGESLWCAAHAIHHGRRHVYAYTSTLAPGGPSLNFGVE